MFAQSRIKKYELRIMIFVLSIILASFFIIHPVYAQSSTPSISPLPSTLPFTLSPLPSSVSPTSPLYTDLLVHNLFHSFSCLAVGQSVIGQPCLTYQVTKNAQGAIQSVPILSSVNLSGGTLGATASLIGALYTNPPVRTADYLASVGQGLGIVKEAHAQVGGSGAAVLNPILSLWTVSRNITYVFMIIIFVIIGLMVMFRNRINPQTVITAQTALPGLVIGLIMITFSYFLAGLISDMAFVGTNLISYFFSAAQNSPIQNLVKDTSTQNILSIFSPFTGIITKEDASNILSAIWGNFSGGAQSILTTAAVFITAQVSSQGTQFFQAIPTVGSAIQAFLVGDAAIVAAANPTAMIGMALSFIAGIILIYSMFKLLLNLIKCYLTIIFLTITAPFQLLVAALPGRQGIATGWILSMLANVLAFPTVFAVLYFVAFLLGPNRSSIDVLGSLPFNITNTKGITGTSAFPLFGGLDLTFINLLLAFGALTALPSIPDLLGRTIGKMSQTGQLIGQEIGGGIGQGRQYAGQFQAGIGQAGGQIAQSRSLWGTTEYMADPSNPQGPPIPNPFGTRSGGVRKFGRWMSSRCLPPDTLISTPFGSKTIKNIRKNDLIWTINWNNKIEQAHVKQSTRRKVSKNHKILHLVLADGRQLFASPGHPDASGRNLALLKKGDYLDHSFVVRTELQSYKYHYTYDVLPEGETGAYFANSILIGSTLKSQKKEEFFQFFSQA